MGAYNKKEQEEENRGREWTYERTLKNKGKDKKVNRGTWKNRTEQKGNEINCRKWAHERTLQNRGEE